jgi:hypothetical protein
MQKCIRLLILLVAFTACKNESENSNQEGDGTNYGDTIIVYELQEVAKVGQSFVLLDSTFDPNTFQEGGSRQVDALIATPIVKEQMEGFMSFLIYNEDSSHAIDPYSYNYVLREKNGKTQVSEAGPDSEIAIIDLKAQTRKRIWFSGPGSRIVDVKWKNKNVIWMSGVEELAPASYRPFIYEIHFNDQTIRSFESGDTLHGWKRNILTEGLQQKIQTTKTSPSF